MANEEGGGCGAPSYTINIVEPVYQSMQGNFFLGQTRLLMFGNGNHAWGGLVNSHDAQVDLHIDSFSVSNYSPYPFVAQVWFNANMEGPSIVSRKVISANTAIKPRPRPSVQLQYGESVPGQPTGGVNPLNRIISPRSTMVEKKGGLFILPPGGIFLVFLASPGACIVRGRIGFSWWETKSC